MCRGAFGRKVEARKENDFFGIKCIKMTKKAVSAAGEDQGQAERVFFSKPLKPKCALAGLKGIHGRGRT
ncbi:hypothetical protein C8Z91_09940 [Paenibacillus elgii]|uniref:Uncharacterized protein n=1 Tax=Paenibacillus elgii TaxID=189691 RepID=A0A2T6G6E9_9BACL|nr:hypothetical protein C8Z91_09940 [Paenibacillus elgii]